ncbi:MAG TPA: SAM-dependent methyltransferase, partial [Flavobacteriales bacterium]|nr:SAM-dependent methyltransferase [Flavobacteriales bacterium]
DHGGIEQLPPENIDLASRITLYFCEHEKTARQMLRRMVPGIDLARIELHRLDKDTTAAEALLKHLSNGRDGAILSEAGMPGIADPGALLVSAAHRSGVTVIPLIGPSSLLLALAASGLNGQSFTFHGYLPVKPAERRQAIKRLEQDAQRSGAAQIFIETPYRNDALLADLMVTCAPGTALCIAIDLTQPGGSAATHRISDWRKRVPSLGKRPAVFIIGK